MYSKGHSVSVNKYSTLLRVKTSLPCSFLLAKLKRLSQSRLATTPPTFYCTVGLCWVQRVSSWKYFSGTAAQTTLVCMALIKGAHGFYDWITNSPCFVFSAASENLWGFLVIEWTEHEWPWEDRGTIGELRLKKTKQKKHNDFTASWGETLGEVVLFSAHCLFFQS